jgi:signal transduction histidine kinase/ligand-binding sensor domain-containing protein/AraC-like DNA-binding protein
VVRIRSWWRGVSLKRWPLLAATLVAVLPASALAQRATLRPSTAFGGTAVIHESWSVADGLPVNAINHLIQSRDGYLWAATFDGLVRFDGVKFTVFNSANSPGLPSNRIIRLEEDPRGDLWLVTEQGHLIRRRAGQFRLLIGAGRANDIRLAHGGDGATWAGTIEGLWQVLDDRVVPVLRDQLRDSVWSILLRRDGTLLVGHGERGLVRLRRGPDGALQPIVAAEDSVLRNTRIRAMLEAPDGTLWLGTNRGLFAGRERWRRVPMSSGGELFDVRVIRPHPARPGVVVHGHRARTGPIVGVADEDRLMAMDSGSVGALPEPPLWTSGATIWYGSGSMVHRDAVPQLRLDNGDTALEGSDSYTYGITTGLVDREGSLWLGTVAGGLHRLKPTVVRTISEAEGLSFRNAYAAYVDRAGAVWVGSQGRGFSRVDPETGRVDGFDVAAGRPDGARTFLETRDGTLWIGANVGVYACSRAPTVTCAAERSADGDLVAVSALHEDPDGRLWVGTLTGLFRRERGRLTRLDAASGAPTATVRAFAVTRDGALWLATDGGGVVRYREGVYTPVTTADGLPSDLVRALYEDADGWLWIGTEGRGLARLDPRGWATPDGGGDRRRIATITTRNGLFDDGIHEVLEDDVGRLWMSSNRGLFWIAREEAMAVADGRAARVRSTGYTERDGMRNREANGGVQPSGAKGRDGRLWFATQDGAVVVDPREIVSDTVAPPLVIEQVVAGDSALLPGETGVRLSPDQRDIRVDFTALTFREPRNVYFRYRLDGYSTDWVESDTRRSAFFTKLPPGRYTFRVQASDARRGWHEPGASLVLEVVPHVYETPVFRGALLVALLGLAGATLARRVRAARRRARELEQLVAERTLALRDREQQLETQNRQLETQAEALQQLDQARSRFFANVSHELRTPLTLMLAPLDRLRAHDRVDAQHERWVDLASRNARRLLELVDQILDVARLEAGAMQLSPSRFDLGALLRGALDGFRMAAEGKQLHLRADVPPSCPITLDPDAVEKIVTNLLSNAVKFTPPAGHVTLRLQRGPETITIAVMNTGPTIPLAQLALVFERFYQVDESRTTIQPGTGIGLSLVKELVELQGGTVRAASAAGLTIFTVELPVSAADRNEPVALVDTLSPEVVALSTSDAAPDDTAADVPSLLVVDDSEDMRAFIRDHFAPQFRVFEAADGREALAIARAQLPDVIVSDVMMPVLDGRAFVRALRADPETDYLAVILLTAQAESEQRIAGLEGGADDYLGKPFEMRELDARVRNQIAARRRLQLRFGAAASGSDAADQTLPAADHAPLGPTDGPPLAADDVAYREKVLAAIRARLGDEDFGVAELADAVAQDRSHLFRRVRQVTGLSPSDLLRQMRVDEGARLLRTTTGSVADVAFSVGFRSVSHFFRCFHERYGVTPTAYRSAPVMPTPSSTP